MKTAKLEALRPCFEALEWAKAQKTNAAAWANCERADWMLWLLGKLSGPRGSLSRRKLVGCAAECAATATKYVKNKGQAAKLQEATALLKRYSQSEAADADLIRARDLARDLAREVRAAAADAAAYDAAYADDAAAAAAYASAATATATTAADAAYAAADAATAYTYAYASAATAAADAAYAAAATAAADAAYAARKKALKAMCAIVRRHYPKAPVLP
jgi:hypothetical protein